MWEECLQHKIYQATTSYKQCPCHPAKWNTEHQATESLILSTIRSLDRHCICVWLIYKICAMRGRTGIGWQLSMNDYLHSTQEAQSENSTRSSQLVVLSTSLPCCLTQGQCQSVCGLLDTHDRFRVDIFFNSNFFKKMLFWIVVTIIIFVALPTSMQLDKLGWFNWFEEFVSDKRY